MLDLPGGTSTERLNPPTKFRLFESEDFIGSSDSIRKAQNRATSRPCKKLRVNNNNAMKMTAIAAPPKLLNSCPHFLQMSIGTGDFSGPATNGRMGPASHIQTIRSTGGSPSRLESRCDRGPAWLSHPVAGGDREPHPKWGTRHRLPLLVGLAE
jgi:hypothetical protein